MFGSYLDIGNPVSAHPLNDKLVSWWMTLPGWQGYKFLDLKGANHGTLTNGPSWGGGGRPGGFGALSLDGTDDYVNFGDQPAFEFASGQSFSLSLWFKGTASTTQRGLLTKGYDTIFVTDDRPWYLLRWNASNTSGALDVFLRDVGGTNSIVQTATNLTDNGWHHACVAHDAAAATLTLYTDGRQNGTPATSVPAAAYGTNGSQLILGTHANSYFAGPVDDFRVHSRALSASEAYALYEDSARGHPLTLRRFSRRVWSFGTVSGPSVTNPSPVTSTASVAAPNLTLSIGMSPVAMTATVVDPTTDTGGFQQLGGGIGGSFPFRGHVNVRPAIFSPGIPR
jgi:hypothetical protein